MRARGLHSFSKRLERFDSLKFIIDEAKGGNVELWTSNFTLAEVYKRSCDGEQKSLLPQQDQTFEEYILQDFVQRVQVDYDVGVLARRLLRAYPIIQKPQDGIHVATALLNHRAVNYTLSTVKIYSISVRRLTAGTVSL